MSEQMFVQRGRNIFNASDRGDEIPKIPTGTYTVQFNPMAGGFFLSRTEDLTLPEKVYGSTLPRADMILNTFLDRKNKTTGALLSGLKGSGKTLLSKAICSKALTIDVPVLILQQAFGGPQFEDWLNTITQPVIIFIDEFEKKYDDDEKQNQLLSILDGTGRGSKLWLATSNSADVSTYLLNRPSRFFYHIPFKKMEEDLLVGYCTDNLQNPKKMPLIKALWSLSQDMSFDILQSVVEEQNRYPDKPFLNLLDDMNVSLNGQLMRSYRLKRVLLNGERVTIQEGQRAMCHLVYFQDGDSKISATIQIPFSKQVQLMEKMKSDEYYFYNEDELKDSKEGKAIDDADCCDEFVIKLAYVEGQTFMNTESLVFQRSWGNSNFEFIYESQKEDPTFSAIDRVFEGLEEK